MLMNAEKEQLGGFWLSNSGSLYQFWLSKISKYLLDPTSRFFKYHFGFPIFFLLRCMVTTYLAKLRDDPRSTRVFGMVTKMKSRVNDGMFLHRILVLLGIDPCDVSKSGTPVEDNSKLLRSPKGIDMCHQASHFRMLSGICISHPLWDNHISRMSTPDQSIPTIHCGRYSLPPKKTEKSNTYQKNCSILVGGFNPSEKYEFVTWDDAIPNGKS